MRQHVNPNIKIFMKPRDVTQQSLFLKSVFFAQNDNLSFRSHDTCDLAMVVTMGIIKTTRAKKETGLTTK